MDRSSHRYHVSLEIRVPLPFAFEWCTDYTPEDGKYAGEDRSIGLVRRIIERTPRRVIFENLYNEGKGWGWERHVVRLKPPRAWHSDGIGSSFESHLDYRLTARPGDRTLFDMKWSSKPMPWCQGGRATPGLVEAWVARLWVAREKAMRPDYVESSGRSSKSRRR